MHEIINKSQNVINFVSESNGYQLNPATNLLSTKQKLKITFTMSDRKKE